MALIVRSSSIHNVGCYTDTLIRNLVPGAQTPVLRIGVNRRISTRARTTFCSG